MTDTLRWIPNLTAHAGPRYRAIADAMAADVRSGRLTPGARLPTHRALAQDLGVTVGTVTRAYAEAERRGLLEAAVGRGSFIRDPGPAAAHAWVNPPADPPSVEPGPGPRGYDLTPPEREPAGLIDMSANYPARTFLAGALTPGLAGLAALAGPDGDPARLTALAGYQPSVGRPEHRAAGARWMARFGLEADPADVIPVHGTQGGLTVILSTLVPPGETLLVEDLTWPGVHYIARRHGLRLVPVAGDGDGLRPDALAEAARRTGARAAYLVPTLHNPLNITMPEARRAALLETARIEGLTLIEDDIYGFLADTPPRPLAARDPDHAVYVTSLSKCVAPALRVGFVKAPPVLVPRIAQAVAADTLMVSPLLLELVAGLIDSGKAAAAAEAQKAEARARQVIARRALPLRLPPGAEASFHVWLRLPEGWRGERFVAEARARGVLVTPGSTFRVDGSDPGGVRLCLSAVPERADLEAGLAIVARLLDAAPHAAMPVV
ncbi:PLP-dependent aminotransferase family protein [Roseospira navarrensis]|nr:PLP-dependent aminotransferase family protein [Roseospira navarrensis]